MLLLKVHVKWIHLFILIYAKVDYHKIKNVMISSLHFLQWDN